MGRCVNRCPFPCQACPIQLYQVYAADAERKVDFFIVDFSRKLDPKSATTSRPALNFSPAATHHVLDPLGSTGVVMSVLCVRISVQNYQSRENIKSPGLQLITLTTNGHPHRPIRRRPQQPWRAAPEVVATRRRDAAVPNRGHLM